MSKKPERSTLINYTALAYLSFVIYGSLVPLDFHHVPWDQALQHFAAIPWLAMDTISRADWVANLVLYMPLAFLLMWAQRPRSSVGYWAVSIVTLTVCITVAVGIEFTQMYFPPRTVSLNDIVAEIIGSVLGTGIWLLAGEAIAYRFSRLNEGGEAALTAAFVLYLLSYLALSLFPYDFVIASNELATRLATGRDSWFVSPVVCSDALRCVARLGEEALVVAPLGALMARWLRGPKAAQVLVAMSAGALLGVLIEITQLFLESGISQGASVVTRALGMGLGAVVYQRLFAHGFTAQIRLQIRWLAALALPFYLVAVVMLQNDHLSGWLNWQAGLARLPEVHFLPFYYHYYTSEALALSSLLMVLAAYSPLGVLAYLWQLGMARRMGAAVPALLAALIAAAVEFSKLFQPTQHPDPTNVMLAALAAAAGYRVLVWMNALNTTAHHHAVRQEAKLVSTADGDNPELDTQDPDGRGGINPLALVSAGILVWVVLRYPLDHLWLGGALLAYMALLWRWPQAWLVAVPAMLPVLDLAPYTGRFFFDEFDCLILATFAVAGWRYSSARSTWNLSAAGWLLLVLFTLSVAIAALLGMYPFPALDLNSFSNYYSHYNALRVAKGLLWILVLLPLLRKGLNQDAVRSQHLLTLGMILGVLVGGFSVLWERAAFTGLLNFSSDYRVVGMFSGMHTGGAYIEGYFATVLPFVAWWTLHSRSVLARLFGVSVFALGVYALLVTYARGGYIALILGMAVLGMGWLLRRSGSLRMTQIMSGLALLLLLAGIAWPIVEGRFMQGRFATVQQDARIRTAHWQEAVDMMDDGAGTQLFGMGLGRYPETYFWRNTSGVRPANYRFITQNNNTWLELSAGDVLYFEQIVAVQRGRHYRLDFDARSRQNHANLTVPVCEKWMLYSTSCVWQSVHVGNTNGQWRHFILDVDTASFPKHPWYARPSVKLSFYNPTLGTLLDVDNVSMRDKARHELVENGSFSAGMDHWFFATNNHLPWHFKDLWLQLYFEQGGIGLALFAALVVYAFITLARRWREPEFPAPALAAALVAFLTVGVVDSLFDVPRIALLFYLLWAWTALRERTLRPSVRDSHRAHPQQHQHPQRPHQRHPGSERSDVERDSPTAR
jgi:VanZ family protein/O-antigen ligase